MEGEWFTYVCAARSILCSYPLKPRQTDSRRPGMGHQCLRNLSLLSSEYGIPVVLYDQLGCGKSTHLREKRLDTDFWVPELFIAELESLLEYLGIAGDFDLLGQSWYVFQDPVRPMLISSHPKGRNAGGYVCDWPAKRAQKTRDLELAGQHAAVGRVLQ